MSRPLRIAFVTPSWNERWRDEDAVAARVAGALACTADVEVLVGGGVQDARAETEGAFRVMRFPVIPRSRSRRVLLGRLVFCGDRDGHDGCTCLEALAPSLYETVPSFIQREYVSTVGGHAPELFARLRAERYDVIVFAGLAAASTVFGIEELPAGARAVLLSLARKRPTLHLPIYRSTLSRADRVLTLTPTESRRVVRLGADPSRVHEIGFATQVSEVATQSEPAVPSREGLVTVVRDWTNDSLQWRLRREAMELRRWLPDVRICLAGPGAERFADDGWTVARQVFSRVDAWRLFSRSIAVLEPEPNRLLAIEAIEGMLYGTPVVARADSDAAREHAERGNGGLWYRSIAELASAVGALCEPDTRAALGAQAKRYATERFGDMRAFLSRVTRAVLGEAA